MRALPLFIALLLAHFLMNHAMAQHQCAADDCFHAYSISKPFSIAPDSLPLDTFIVHLHRVPQFSSEVFFPALTGNTGRPGVDLWKDFSPDQSQGYFFHNPYKLHFRNSDNLEMIRSSVPYAEWYYLTGADREQIFRALHAQDAGKALNFGLDLKYINSKGAYLHQHTKTSFAGFYAQYRDPLLPVTSDLAVIFNRATAQENGGISDPEWFEDTVKINRQLVPVWSTSAITTIKTSEVRLRSTWSPGSLPAVSGSPAVEDSLPNQGPIVPSIAIPVRVLEHLFALDLRLIRWAALYHDTDPFNPWYPVVRYPDTSVTHDTVASTLFSADLSYRIKAWDRIFVTSGLVAGSYRTYDTLIISHRGSFVEPYTLWQFRLWSALRLDARAALRQDASFGTSHQITASMRWKLLKHLWFKAEAKDWTAYPFWQDLQYASNHYFWINDFKQQHFTQLAASLEFQGRVKLTTSALATRIANWIYYDTRAIPVQNDGSFSLVQWISSADYRIGNWNFFARIAIQRSTDQALLRQPVVMGESSASYRFSLFSGKIQAMAGAIVHGASASYRDEYAPVIRVFYQSTTSPEQAYVWVDPFVNFVIKKTRFMLRYDHASAWIAGFGRYTITGYPMRDPALRFSVSWRFMD